MDFDPSLLKAGDSLLYYGESPTSQAAKRGGFVDWSIAVKTGYWLAHIEIYWGANMSVASRNGIGVNRYQFRLPGLVCVRRPTIHLDTESADRWFADEARGQGYDFKGLMCFWLAARQGSRCKMFCSEFATRWYRHAQFQPFNTEVDADRVAPCEFWKSAMFETIWIRKGFEP